MHAAPAMGTAVSHGIPLLYLPIRVYLYDRALPIALIPKHAPAGGGRGGEGRRPASNSNSSFNLPCRVGRQIYLLERKKVKVNSLEKYIVCIFLGKVSKFDSDMMNFKCV